MKMWIQLILLLIIVLIVSYLIFYFSKNAFAPDSPYSLGTVCVKDNCFKVEIAKTEKQREEGLMERKSLDKDKGMLFIFDKESIYPFWMKNTFISLDIIWIDNSYKVVDIKENNKPCNNIFCSSIYPSSKAKYVLEINAGLCSELGIKKGDFLDMDEINGI